MPSIITHDTFGRDLYSTLPEIIGQSDAEKDAYLLGCQGPDVLFYGSINPLAKSANSFGRALHRGRCTKFLTSLIASYSLLTKKYTDKVVSDITQGKDGIADEDGNLFEIGINATRYAELSEKLRVERAFILGFAMHWQLDSVMHPFVFSQQYSICDAGVEGLDRRSGSEVHVEIERELDELVLYVKRKEIIESFNPAERILIASNSTLLAIDELLSLAIPKVYNRGVSPKMYTYSVKASRQVQRLLYSAGGIKRTFIGDVETVFRRHSYLRAITHRNRAITRSEFDNAEHDRWVDPWVKSVSYTDSFWDLYDKSLATGIENIGLFAGLIDKGHELADFGKSYQGIYTDIFEDVKDITRNKNFYGVSENIINEATGKPEGY